MENNQRLISIVVPVYCEELIINEFHRKITDVFKDIEHRYRYEVIFVNDGSTDRSLEILKDISAADPNIKVISLSRNFGHQIATTAGIDHAAGDAVVLIDGDLQDPPEVIKQMIEKWGEGYDVVHGVRTKREGESMFKLITAKIFYRLLSKLSDINIPMDSGDFRLMDRNVVNALKSMHEQDRFLRGMIPWIGFKHFGLEYKRDQRYAGKTKFSFNKMLRFALDGITGYSDKPLYISFRLGIIISISSFIMILFYIIKKIVFPESVIHGWTSTIILILFLGGIQLISLGIMGLYIGRIYREVKRRPLYLVSEKFGLNTGPNLEHDECEIV